MPATIVHTTILYAWFSIIPGTCICSSSATPPRAAGSVIDSNLCNHYSLPIDVPVVLPTWRKSCDLELQALQPGRGRERDSCNLSQEDPFFHASHRLLRAAACSLAASASGLLGKPPNRTSQARWFCDNHDASRRPQRSPCLSPRLSR